MSKEYTDKERWNIAAKLEGILGADLDVDEEEAIENAIEIICPQYAEAMDAEIRETADWLENTPMEEQIKFIEEQSGRPFDPKAEYEKYKLRFGEIGKGRKP